MAEMSDGLCHVFDDDASGRGASSQERGERGGQNRPKGQGFGPQGGGRGRGEGDYGASVAGSQLFASAGTMNSGIGGRPWEWNRRASRGRGSYRGGWRGDSWRVGGGSDRGRGSGPGRGEGRGRGDGGYGGGRGGRGRPRTFRIQNYVDCDSADELTMKLTSSITEFKEFVDDVFMDPKDATKLLKILEKVVSSDLHRESAQNILLTICTSHFLDTHLINLITHLRSNMDLDFLFDNKVKETAETIQRIHLLLNHVCRKLPSYASKGSLLLSFLTSQHDIISFLRQHRLSLEKDLQDLKEDCDRAMTMMHDVSQRQEKGARSKRGPNEDDEIPPEDFNTLPIFPEGRDMDWSEKPFLRPNKAEGAFKDVHHYLDVQFRLLREDYIRPLREGIREYRRMREKGEQVKKNSDFRLYHRVQVIGLSCKEALEHRVQFDISHMKHVRWQSSKRLLYGSLVCLSVDDFENISFAIVTNRDIKDLENGIIQIRFESGIEDVLDSTAGDVFTMAETTAYFETYRHVLEGLQEMQQNFPMAPYIVECQKNVKPPKYVYSSGGLARMDLRSLLHERSRFPASAVSVVNPKMWPPLEETAFDDSQYKAVQTALTKELAIVQGPPGTGKTYVGLKVAKVLLENRHVWNPPGESLPILVVCYTNHALDQFLEGILEFLPKGIVRVGSHCKNPSLEEFNLKHIRSQTRREKKTSLSVHNSIRDCFKALCGLRQQVERVSSRLEASTKGVVSEKALQYTMPDYHYRSLVSRPSYDGMGKPLSVMMDWLTSDMTSWDQEMDTVMYGQLVEEVMSQILEGTDTSFDMATVSQDNIHSLHPKVRAQLYRSWKERADHQLQQQVETAVAAGKDPTQFVELQDLASHEILPDSVLLGAVHRTLYVAIRARILQLQPARKQNQYGQQDPSDYCIRTWLGIPWSPDLGVLQDTLDQLTEDDPEAGDEDKLNVEEEADLVQRERQLDDDDDRDLFDFGVRKSYTVKDAMADLGVVDAKSKRGQAADPGGWMMTPQQKKQQAKKIQHLLKSATAMTEAEAGRVTDVWSTSLKLQDRVRLYLYWLQKYQRDLKKSIKQQADDYAKEARRMRELRFGEDQEILREATVIGMTTTGAARYRRVLTSVACPIVMLEEAARVLEAHVVTTLHKSCQHLILIGDQQQFRPSPTVYELSRDYKLDLSLFERLVKNELPHSTLGVQHRMRPEVAELVRHIYPHLQDHDTTRNRPHIRGLEKDVFLLHHEVAEERHDETRSKSNSHEAELCVGLCRYLLQQGYPPDKITILAAYSGQVLALKTLFKKNGTFFQGVRVTAVDNFQGEENDVIILSLVRSNEQGSVGFLSTDNRVCVALSRARNGMYAFGNFKLLAEKSELWKSIAKTAKQHGQMSDALVLRCENHPGQEIRVSTAKDFDSAPEGGCKKPCNTRLACGHVCDLPCHAYDRAHERYKCRKKCERKVCDKGHPCTRKCHEECGKCLYKVEKTVPMCGHTAMIECSRDPHTWRCASRCEGRLPCGHQCSGKCGECRQKNSHVSLCTEEVERMWPCGHLVKSACNVVIGDLPCRAPCDAKLDCGHDCPGTCGQCLGGRVHVPCKKSCGKVLPGCGHKCPLLCGTKCLPCKKKCGTACKHSSCTQICGEPCNPCMEKCPWKCAHKKCDSVCHEPCEPCSLACLKKLNCEHECLAFCGEKCFCLLCEKASFVPLFIAGVLSEEESSKVVMDKRHIKLPRCGHIFRADVLDVYVEKKTRSLPAGVALTCPLHYCQQMILEWDCWRYHGVLRKRHSHLQETKKKLVENTTVAKARQDKIIKSMGLLTHNAVAEKSFASRSARQSLGDKGMDVNKAFALTNQIKLTRVTETILKVLQDFSSTLVDQFSVKQKTLTLQKVLLKPMANMTDQRLKELKAETQRLAYMALFATAPLDRHKVQTYLQTLDDGRGQPSIKFNMMMALSACQCDNSVWRSRAYDVINLAILKASLDQMARPDHVVMRRCNVASRRTPCGVKPDRGHDFPGTCGQCLGGRVHVLCKNSDTPENEGSEYSSTSPKPSMSTLASLDLSIPLTELQADGQSRGHNLRLSKSDTDLLLVDAAISVNVKRSSSVHSFGHSNTLRNNLKSKVLVMKVLGLHSVDPKKNPSIGNPPSPISRKFWESSSTVSSAGGTVQKPDSDVILNVPPNAVDKDAKIDVYTAVCTDMDRVRRILNLAGDECVCSPLAEYWAGHEFRFKKPVSITLPAFLPQTPDPQLVRVYRVAHRCDGQLAITRLRPREEAIRTVHFSDEQYTKQTTEADPHVPTTSRKSTIGQVADCAGNLPWETDGYFWLSSDGQVIINTDHFCGYVCTYCNLQQGPPVLEAIVCGSHTREEEGQQSAQITLYIWDKRLYIKDFQQDNGIDFKQIVGERSFSLRAFSGQLQRSKVHVRLGLVGLDKADWQHVMDDGCPTLPPEQQCDLGELLSCNDENCCAAKATFRCPLSFDWWLESKPGCQPRSVLRCVVDIIHLKPDEHPVWRFEDTTKRLPVRILRRTDPSESCTLADSRQSSATPPTPSSPPEHVVPTCMGTTRMYGQPPVHPVPQNHQRPQNSSYETMNNHNIGDVGSLTSSAADGHSTPAKIVARDHSFSSSEGAVGGLRHPGEHATQDQLSGFPGASTSSRTLFSGGPSQSGHQAMEMPAELPSFAQIQGVPCRYQGDAMSAEHCGLAGQQVEASNGHGLSTCSLPGAAGGDSHRVTQNIVIINKPINNHHYNNIGKIQGDPTFASSVTNHSGPRIENDDHTSMHVVPYREGSTGGAQSYQSPAVDVARRYLELHGDLQVIGQHEVGYSDPSLNPQRGTNLTDMRNPLCSPSQ